MEPVLFIWGVLIFGFIVCVIYVYYISNFTEKGRKNIAAKEHEIRTYFRDEKTVFTGISGFKASQVFFQLMLLQELLLMRHLSKFV